MNTELKKELKTEIKKDINLISNDTLNITNKINENINKEDSKINKNICKYCNKTFKSYQSCNRHMNHYCKIKKNLKENSDELLMIQLNNSIFTLNKNIEKLINKYDKILNLL